MSKDEFFAYLHYKEYAEKVLVFKTISEYDFNTQTPGEDKRKHDKKFFYNSWPENVNNYISLSKSYLTKFVLAYQQTSNQETKSPTNCACIGRSCQFHIRCLLRTPNMRTTKLSESIQQSDMFF